MSEPIEVRLVLCTPTVYAPKMVEVIGQRFIVGFNWGTQTNNTRFSSERHPKGGEALGSSQHLGHNGFAVLPHPLARSSVGALWIVVAIGRCAV